MRKTIVALLFVSIAIAGCFWGINLYRNTHIKDEPEQTEKVYYPSEHGVYILREEEPTDIVWYGKGYKFPNRYPDVYNFNVPVRYENEVSDDILKIKKGFERQIIVLSDYDSTLEFTHEELIRCLSQAINSRYCYFLYLGTKKNEEIISALVELKVLDPVGSDIDVLESNMGNSLSVQLLDKGVKINITPIREEGFEEWIWDDISSLAEEGEINGTGYK